MKSGQSPNLDSGAQSSHKWGRSPSRSRKEKPRQAGGSRGGAGKSGASVAVVVVVGREDLDVAVFVLLGAVARVGDRNLALDLLLAALAHDFDLHGLFGAARAQLVEHGDRLRHRVAVDFLDHVAALEIQRAALRRLD